MNKKLRLGVVFGGRSSEHEVSLASATSVLQNLNVEKYDIVPIAIDRTGGWRLNIRPEQMRVEAGESGESGESGATPSVTLTIDPTEPRLIPLRSNEALAHAGVLDLIFPVLHGPYGEDGTIQGLLEMANIPYVGCGVLGSALAMDKEKTKVILRAQGLPVLEAVTSLRGEWARDPEQVIARVEQSFAYPCFVKPANQGSSVGVGKASNREQLVQAINTALDYDRKIIVEQGLSCREFSCAVLGNDEPQASVIGEIIAGNEFSDYNDKYIDHKIRFEIPSSLPQATSKRLREQAIQAYQALNLSGLTRVDFFLDRETDQFYINEVNTMPGFTSQSLYPKLWAASGLAYPDLLDRLIDLALERYAERQQNRVTL
jgi:D-alanine-D-alanine ligase